MLAHGHRGQGDARIGALVLRVAVREQRQVRRIAERGLIFSPLRERDVHSVPTPRLGGVAIFAGVMVGLLFASRTPFLEELFEQPAPIIGIAGAAAMLCLLGVIDDIWDLHWITKLAGQTLAAGFMALNGVAMLSIPFNEVIIGSPRMSIIVTVLLVVAFFAAVGTGAVTTY